jgi:hypothetical protein
MSFRSGYDTFLCSGPPRLGPTRSGGSVPKKKTNKNTKSAKKSKNKPKAKSKPKGKANSGEVRKVELDLTVRSEHPSLPAPAAAEQIRKLAPELSQRLKAKYGEGTVEVERQKTFPADPATILVTIGIFVGLELAKAVISEITRDVYHWVEEKIVAANVTQAAAHRTKRTKRR